MTTRRRKRDPNTRFVVYLPDRPLSESILHLAAPLLEPLGSSPGLEEARRAVGLAIDVWNAHVAASPVWGCPDPAPLSVVRKAMCGKQAPPGLADAFEVLSSRWRTEFSLDPRLVGKWSLEATAPGRQELVCEAELPEGVEAHVPPPLEKRVAIGGKFLDEVSIRQSATSYLSFPVESHRGDVGADGSVTIQSKLPTVVALFADGRLTPVGGAPVDLMVGGKKLAPCVLAEVRCTSWSTHDAVAVLIFRRASGETGG